MFLFEPFKQRGVTLRNRIGVSPMCQYSATNGHATSWHLVHLGSRAVGGAALVMAEATAVESRGRISPDDAGLWLDSQSAAWEPVTRFIREQGAVPGVQLAHAGRKGSTSAPFKGGKPLGAQDGGFDGIVAPSALAFDTGYAVPAAMGRAELTEVTRAFEVAAERALAAGFELLEVHAAHGYLLHQFLSPLSNQRTDDYGGSFEKRARFVLEVVAAVRRVWPERLPLWLRISATDWAPGGWDLEQSCELCRLVRDAGVDLVDVSSGGLLPRVKIPVGHGYQAGFSAEIRKRCSMPTAAVGMITAPEQAEHLIASGQADFVLLARELLRQPYWPLQAARALGVKLEPPAQYARAF